ncbi:MAG: thioesterase [Bacteroidetes bacterium]|nr:thioesterase [Bacteroidota bacterium]
MSLPENFQFEKVFEVGAFQVHPHGALRLCSMGDFFQEIAWQHADSEGFGRSLLEQQLMWALSRIEIKVSQFPRWGGRLRIFTAGRGQAGVFAFREFLVLNEREEVLARAMSSWLLVHLEKKRILKPESVLPSAIFNTLDSPSWQPRRLEASGPIVDTSLILVQHSDLDLYNHVNNTSYIRWVENRVAVHGLFPSQIAINYLAECKAGDEVSLTLLGAISSPFLQGRVQGKLVFEAQINSL